MHFWSLNCSGRKLFVLERVNKHDVERRRAKRAVSRKNSTFKYTFECRDGSVREVCTPLSLGTPGLSPKDDTIVMKAIKNNVNINNAHIDGRGKHASRASDEDSFKIFIKSYHTVVSHYYQEKAPQRRYLPCDVTVTSMHKAYSACHSPIYCSKFYRVFKAMRISMTSLANEECEVCERYKQY